jgi:hypothetical protein
MVMAKLIATVVLPSSGFALVTISEFNGRLVAINIKLVRTVRQHSATEDLGSL